MKTDRAFISDIKSDGSDGELAMMIISMRHTLGMNVIAEGVETKEHMHFLLQHNCSEAQGYYISKPLPAAGFEAQLLDRTGYPLRGNLTPDVVLFRNSGARRGRKS